MPERKRIVRFEIVFSCIPFLLRLSQIVEPEPEPHPRPPRIRLKITYGFRTLSLLAVSPTNPDLSLACDAGLCFILFPVLKINLDLCVQSGFVGEMAGK